MFQTTWGWWTKYYTECLQTKIKEQKFNFLNLTLLWLTNPITWQLFQSFKSIMKLSEIDHNSEMIKSMSHWQFLITHIYSVYLKFKVCYITSLWGKFRVKNAILCLLILFWHFIVFHLKIVFLSFSFLFLTKIEYPQIDFNQSETGVGDTKLPVELYVKHDGNIYFLSKPSKKVNLSRLWSKNIEFFR